MRVKIPALQQRLTEQVWLILLAHRPLEWQVACPDTSAGDQAHFADQEMLRHPGRHGASIGAQAGEWGCAGLLGLGTHQGVPVSVLTWPSAALYLHLSSGIMCSCNGSFSELHLLMPVQQKL